MTLLHLGSSTRRSVPALAVLALLSTAGDALAQDYGPDGGGYFASDVPNAFFDVSGSGTDVTGLIANLDDGGVVVPLGFPFQYYGATLSSIGFSTNGYLAAEGGLTDFTSDCPLVSGNPPNHGMYPYWGDLRLNEHGSMQHETLGTAPNRVFFAQWTDAGAFNDSAAHVTMQVQVFEADDSIEFHYGPLFGGSTFDVTGGTGSIGTEAPGGVTGLEMGCNTPGTLASNGDGYRIELGGLQVHRSASPPNSGTIHVGTTAPTVGGVWDPLVLHALPSPALDFLAISTLPGIEVASPFGTLLCVVQTPLLRFNFAPGTRFAVPMPTDPSLIGLDVCVQGGSAAFPLQIGLTNGLDVVLAGAPLSPPPCGTGIGIPGGSITWTSECVTDQTTAESEVETQFRQWLANTTCASRICSPATQACEPDNDGDPLDLSAAGYSVTSVASSMGGCDTGFSRWDVTIAYPNGGSVDCECQ